VGVVRSLGTDRRVARRDPTVIRYCGVRMETTFVALLVRDANQK
jgi:hypothetical protein